MKTQHAAEIAKVLYNEIFCRYGAPKQLYSDRGQNFLSRVIRELCNKFDVTKLNTSAYRPQSNACCERFNASLNNAIRAYLKGNTKDWPEVLPSILMAYRMTPSVRSTGVTPYFLLFKQDSRLMTDVALETKTLQPETPGLAQIIKQFNAVRPLIRANVKEAQIEYKEQYDRKAKHLPFQVGQRVWVYYPNTEVHKAPKHQVKWKGPFYVSEVLKFNTYMLRHSITQVQLRAPVHGDRLKPFFDPLDRPTNSPQSVLPVPLPNAKADASPSPVSDEKGDGELFEVERLLECRRKDNATHYLVLWKGFRKRDATWEPAENIPYQVRQNFHLRYTNAGRRRKNKARSKTPESKREP